MDAIDTSYPTPLLSQWSWLLTLKIWVFDIDNPLKILELLPSVNFRMFEIELRSSFVVTHKLRKSATYAGRVVLGAYVTNVADIMAL